MWLWRIRQGFSFHAQTRLRSFYLERGGPCCLVGEVPWYGAVVSSVYGIPGAGGRWKSSALGETFAAGERQRTAPLCMVQGKGFWSCLLASWGRYERHESSWSSGDIPTRCCPRLPETFTPLAVWWMNEESCAPAQSPLLEFEAVRWRFRLTCWTLHGGKAGSVLPLAACWWPTLNVTRWQMRLDEQRIRLSPGCRTLPGVGVVGGKSLDVATPLAHYACILWSVANPPGPLPPHHHHFWLPVSRCRSWGQGRRCVVTWWGFPSLAAGSWIPVSWRALPDAYLFADLLVSSL